MATVIKLENDGIQWFELNGVDYGTNYEFNLDVYGLTEDDRILNCEGHPLTEGDVETIAVRNTIKNGNL